MIKMVISFINNGFQKGYGKRRWQGVATAQQLVRSCRDPKTSAICKLTSKSRKLDFAVNSTTVASLRGMKHLNEINVNVK